MLRDLTQNSAVRWGNSGLMQQQWKLVLFWSLTLWNLQQLPHLNKTEACTWKASGFLWELSPRQDVVTQRAGSGWISRGCGVELCPAGMDDQNHCSSAHQTSVFHRFRRGGNFFPAVTFLLDLCWDFWVFGKQRATPAEPEVHIKPCRLKKTTGLWEQGSKRALAADGKPSTSWFLPLGLLSIFMPSNSQRMPENINFVPFRSEGAILTSPWCDVLENNKKLHNE